MQKKKKRKKENVKKQPYLAIAYGITSDKKIYLITTDIQS
jgi:hypothetical protein